MVSINELTSDEVAELELHGYHAEAPVVTAEPAVEATLEAMTLEAYRAAQAARA